MSARRVDHESFVIERLLEAARPRAFAAYASAEAKRSWFVCSDDMLIEEYRLDFRVGGDEFNSIRTADGTRHIFRGHYLDIVPDVRLIYAYGMYVDDTRLSASLTTIEFHDAGDKTRMVFTEQVAFLDGNQTVGERIHGTELGLDMLQRWLAAG